MEDFLFVPLILFLIIVAPIWIIMHYRSQREKQSGLTESEHQRLKELTEIADAMMDRVEALESILDQENPGWRSRHAAE